MKRIVCEPNWLEPIKISCFADSGKVDAIISTYNRGIGKHWSGRPYIMEAHFEEDNIGK